MNNISMQNLEKIMIPCMVNYQFANFINIFTNVSEFYVIW